jgi:hypothetical protein
MDGEVGKSLLELLGGSKKKRNMAGWRGGRGAQMFTMFIILLLGSKYGCIPKFSVIDS